LNTPLPVGDAAEPRHAFDESRRLTGANRYAGGPAVVLEPAGPAALDGATHGRWIAQVLSMTAALGWPPAQPRVHAHGQGDQAGVMLAFAAPALTLFTATEVNEWAWERAAAWHPGHAAAGFDLAQPADEDSRAHFRERAAAEYPQPLAVLCEAAEAQGLPWLLDDDTLSLGEGSGCVVYPRSALPPPQDVPWERLHAVPKVLVTGSNGKTTTTRLLAAMAQAAGHTAGLCGTEGVVVAGQVVDEGDYAGPAGARAVLRHPAVTAAFMETARGGILRRGLAVQRADVALVTNVSADHLGEYGIHSLDDIAQTKLVLAHAVAGHGTLVINGDDETLLRVAVQSPHAAAAGWAAFAHDHDAGILRTLRQHGGSTCGVRDGRLVLAKEGAEHDLGAVRDMPLALGGAATFNIDNLAAAALAAAELGLPLDAVRSVLQHFGSQAGDNPGRLQRLQHQGATVLLDYAHNPDGLAQLLAVARALQPQRLGLLLGQAGNRSDEAIVELARTAAACAPDRVLIKELPHMLRGRAPGSVPALIERGLLDGGLAPEHLAHQPDEEAAARALLDWAQLGDVVVLPVHTTAVRDRLVQTMQAGQG
jgi:UDP-N-acetylmuramyl tripeptide synthase